MINITTRKTIGGGLRRWIAWWENDYGFVIAAWGLTENHARNRLFKALDAADAARVLILHN